MAYLLAIYCQTPILTVVDTLTVDTGIIWEFLKKPRISLLFRPCPTVCNCQTVKAVFLTLDVLTLDVLTVDTLTLDALTLDTLTVAVLTVDALTVDALTVDALTVDTLTLAVLTLDIDSLFFASIKIKQASIPHDRRRKLVIFKMKLKKFNSSYLEVLAFSEKICYNRKREKKCGTAANSTTSYPAASCLKKTMLQTFYSPFLLPQL